MRVKFVLRGMLLCTTACFKCDLHVDAVGLYSRMLHSPVLHVVIVVYVAQLKALCATVRGLQACVGAISGCLGVSLTVWMTQQAVWMTQPGSNRGRAVLLTESCARASASPRHVMERLCC